MGPSDCASVRQETRGVRQILMRDTRRQRPDKLAPGFIGFGHLETVEVAVAARLAAHGHGLDGGLLGIAELNRRLAPDSGRNLGVRMREKAEDGEFHHPQ